MVMHLELVWVIMPANSS